MWAKVSVLFLAQPRTAQPRAVDGRVALAVHTHSTSPTHPRTAGTPGVRPAQDAVMGIYPNTHLQRDMQQIHRCKGTLPETSHTHTHTHVDMNQDRQPRIIIFIPMLI